mgnify:CR=1 FL=1
MSQAKSSERVVRGIRRKTPSRIRTEPGQALDGTSCEVQTWTNTDNTVGELSPEELSVAGLPGRTGDTLREGGRAEER